MNHLKKQILSELHRYKSIVNYNTRVGIDKNLIVEVATQVEEPFILAAEVLSKRLPFLQRKNLKLYNELEYRITNTLNNRNISADKGLAGLAERAAIRGRSSADAIMFRNIIKYAGENDKTLAKSISKIYVRESLKYYLAKVKEKNAGRLAENPWLVTRELISTNLGDNIASQVEKQIRNNKVMSRVIEKDISNVTESQLEAWLGKDLPLPTTKGEWKTWIPGMVRFYLNYWYNGLFKKGDKLISEIATLSKQIESAGAFNLPVALKIQKLLTKLTALTGKKSANQLSAYSLFENYVKQNPNLNGTKTMKEILKYVNSKEENKSMFKGLFDEEWNDNLQDETKNWYAAKKHFLSSLSAIKEIRYLFSTKKTKIEAGIEPGRLLNYILFHDSRTNTEVSRALAIRGPYKTLMSKIVLWSLANFGVLPALRTGILAIYNNLAPQAEKIREAYNKAKQQYSVCKTTSTQLKNLGFTDDKLPKCEELNPDTDNNKIVNLQTDLSELYKSQVNSFGGIFDEKPYTGGRFTEYLKSIGYGEAVQAAEIGLLWTSVDDIVFAVGDAFEYFRTVKFDETKIDKFFKDQISKIDKWENENANRLRDIGWDDGKDLATNLASLQARYAETESQIKQKLIDAAGETDKVKKDSLYLDAFKEYCQQKALIPVNNTGTTWSYTDKGYFMAQPQDTERGTTVTYHKLNSTYSDFEEVTFNN